MIRFWDTGARGGNVLGLRGFGGGGHGRVPVEQAAATIAGQQFAFAELVPHLGSDAHAATCALLVFRAGEAGAAGAGEAVEANEPFRLNELTKRFAFGIERGQFGGELVLADCDAGTGFVEGGGEGFDLGASDGERGFLGLRALKAGKLFIFEVISFGDFESDFVLDGVGLLGSLYGVELSAEANCLMAVCGDFAFETGAEGFFAVEGIGGLGGLSLGGG